MHEQNVCLLGSSVSTRRLLDDIANAARTDAKVLITGESGTGKEVAARLIHQRSRRQRHPMTTINCAGLPDALLESELFGHRRGSFTGAFRDKPGLLQSANGGTVFLDEVGEMTQRMQALLLRFLETGEIQPVGGERIESCVDVRVIAATNRNLGAQVRANEFRLDLFYRLKVIHLHVPPLRDRVDDIPDLVAHFTNLYATRYRLPLPRLSHAALAKLREYPWPGNVRELKNVVEQVVVKAAADREIGCDDLPIDVVARVDEAPPAANRAAAPNKSVDALFLRMVANGESFWSVVYGPFMQRDLTRDDVRALVRHGLEKTRGSYTALVAAFNLPQDDYKRFLSFLRKHQCQVDFQSFRTAPAHGNGSGRQADGWLPAGRRIARETVDV